MRKLYILQMAGLCLLFSIIGCEHRQKLSPHDYYMEKQEIVDAYLNRTQDTTRYEDFMDCLDKWQDTPVLESFWTTLYSKYDIENVYFKRETGSTELPIYSIKLIAKSNRGYLLIESDVSTPGQMRINSKVISKSELQNILNEIENKHAVFTLISDLGHQYIADASCSFITARWSEKENAFLYYDMIGELVLSDSLRYTTNQLKIARLNIFIDSLFYY